ncbi:MAG TPA: aryl-sulfate sulfotransferase [Saprospiraceae bacterium]|nr:aryl-sulfate sulfotransferase [Saprospiraceae bacterium]HPQ99756.1 aryl-sulfate sulfotransferase [Saprospiraceae bacterium]HQU53251.1 aryl-sulfate sulfotransferase [Saprospiraceae bacterium]HRV86618.1 aryl-sulfate sulfotransferase [Saprospiraceae bacterium]
MLFVKRIPILSCIFFFVAASAFEGKAQNTVGLLSIKQNQVFEGYNLIYPYAQSTVFLVDLCGEVVHQWLDFTGGRPAASAYLLPNGYLVRCSRDRDFSTDTIVAGGFGEYVDILTWENKKLYSFAINNSRFRLHHDVAPMPNGNILMLAWERVGADEIIPLGRDPNTLPNNELWPDKILEWDPVKDSIVWEWRSLDHFVQDRDSILPNFGVVSEHPEKIDINYDIQHGNPDWMHSNYIDYNPVLDQIMISVRNFNEFWIIDHSTTSEQASNGSGGRSGKGGDILYRWGNPAAYQQGDESKHYLHLQHDAHWCDPYALPGSPQFGEIAVFDNFTEANKSTALLIKINFDSVNWTYPRLGRVYGPDSPIRVVSHPNENILSFSNILSSVQKLPNGNVLVFAGRWGYAYEVDENDELVWEYRIPFRDGKVVSQGDVLSFGDNETFNMVRYNTDYSAFANRDLFPIGYLELNPDMSFCYQTSSTYLKYVLPSLIIWPNPATNYLYIKSVANEIEFYSILNVNGQIVRKFESSGNAVDISDLPNGMYLLQASNGKMSRFMILRY